MQIAQILRERQIPLPKHWAQRWSKSSEQDVSCYRYDAGERVRQAIENGLQYTAHDHCVGRDGASCRCEHLAARVRGRPVITVTALVRGGSEARRHAHITCCACTARHREDETRQGDQGGACRESGAVEGVLASWDLPISELIS